jgi:hypothetical protein
MGPVQLTNHQHTLSHSLSLAGPVPRMFQARVRHGSGLVARIEPKAA